MMMITMVMSRSDDLNLGEVFEAMSKKDHQRLWGGVLSVVSPVVEEGRFLLQDEQVKGEEKCLGASYKPVGLLIVVFFVHLRFTAVAGARDG